MCGIFGYSFKKNVIEPINRVILATNLARSNDERGGDSWGIVGMNPENEYSIHRGIGYLNDHAIKLCKYDTLFAHTRKATHGKATVANAHPFKVGKILGAHNGMIFNHEELLKKYKRKFVVDSQHIFAHLDSNLSFKDMEGYGAIEWIEDQEPQNIYLSRLYGGELNICGLGDDPNNTTGIIWSSNFRHLTDALRAADIKEYFTFKVNTSNVYCVNDGELYVMGFHLKLTPPKYATADDDKPFVRSHYLGVKNDDFRLYNMLYGGRDV